MKRLERFLAVSAKYSGSREIRSSEVLLYLITEADRGDRGKEGARECGRKERMKEGKKGET